MVFVLWGYGWFLHFSFLCCLLFRQLCLHKLWDKKNFFNSISFFFFLIYISVLMRFSCQLCHLRPPLFHWPWCPDTLISAGSSWPWAANLWWPTWLPTGNSPHHTDRIRGKTSNEGGFCPWPWFQLPSPQGAVTKTTTTCAVGSSTQLAMWLPWLIPDVLTQQEVRKRKFSPRQLGAPQD